MNKNQIKKNKGFTLIELLVVVAIIGMLAGILIPVVGDARKKAQITSTVTSLESLAKTIQSMDDLSPYPFTADMTTAAQVSSVATGNTFSAVANAAALNNALRFDQILLSKGKIPKLFESPLVNQKMAVDAAGNLTPAVLQAADPRFDPVLRRFRRGDGQDIVTTHSWNTCARIECSPSNTTIPSAANGRNFFIIGGTTNLPAGCRVVYAVIPGLTAELAWKLAKEINGEAAMDNIETDITGQTATALTQNRGRVVFGTPVDGVVDVYVYLAHG